MSQRPFKIVRTGAENAPPEPSAPPEFDDFFATESKALFRRLWLVTRNRAEAEEVMQDAFLSLYERWDRMATIDDPKAYRTAFNAWKKRSRRAARALRTALAPPARETMSTPPTRARWSAMPSQDSARDSARRSS